MDIHIGQRIRDTRLGQNMKLETLSERLGIISQQQLQKYESGANRVSGSMMLRIASVLDVHPGHFFSGYEDPKTKQRLPAISPHGFELLRQLERVPPNLAAKFVQMLSTIVGILNRP